MLLLWLENELGRGEELPKLLPPEDLPPPARAYESGSKTTAVTKKTKAVSAANLENLFIDIIFLYLGIIRCLMINSAERYLNQKLQII